MAQRAEAGADCRDDEVVRAAGCVLWRRAADGGVEVALVHRPRWDDWSHPKGKLHPGETPADAARREVREETGMECVLGTSLRAAQYEARGRRKEVSYWAAEATDGAFVPNGEVDELRWLPPDEARAQLSHPGNRALLDEALTALQLS
ncbi:NUDIX hydrolase [Streptomyces sp. URMC 129]|uniref:NUDIX hydrolase n=1 Tax=Streptomyces sp. URMC 129 TaxID=3423407 RepID=UPI003F1A5044